NNGAGSSLRWRLPVADGSYTLRLHFVEPRGYAPGQQQFDIVVNGVVVAANYDVRAAAGATLKAVAASFAVTAGGDNGLTLELVDKTGLGVILSGLELRRANPGGSANARVNVEVSMDQG